MTADAQEETFDPLANEDPRIVRLAERFARGEIALVEYEKRLDEILSGEAALSPAIARPTVAHYGMATSWPKLTTVWSKTHGRPTKARP